MDRDCWKDGWLTLEGNTCRPGGGLFIFEYIDIDASDDHTECMCLMLYAFIQQTLWK